MRIVDLSTSSARYRARLAGLNVPKRKPGIKIPDFDSLVLMGGPSECWGWLGRKSRDGYGLYCIKRKYYKAHRLAWSNAGHDLPAGKVLMHSCDNPACCNILHLSIGTHSDNQRDKFIKGRQAKGEQNGEAILTEADVMEIRSRYKRREVTYKMLANEFGVCKDTIQKAVRGIYWKHVPMVAAGLPLPGEPNPRKRRSR